MPRGNGESPRKALQNELEDFTGPGWWRKPPELPARASFLPPVGPALTEYRARLLSLGTWGPQTVWHQAGTIPWVHGNTAERLGINVFSPAGPSRGVVLFVHGYLAHAADFAYTFSLLTGQGWTVVTVDLPGHGLSTGVRADIDTFDDYGRAVRSWLGWFHAQNLPGPVVLLAHSLGTAASLEALWQPDVPVPDQVIFCAPLLRVLWHKWLVVGEKVAGWALREVPSQLGTDGYLDGTAATVHWFTVLRQWLRRLDDRPSLNLPLTIVSGDQDQVVDQAWNRARYRRLVPHHRYVLLPGLDHVFLTSPQERAAAHERLLDLIRV